MLKFLLNWILVLVIYTKLTAPFDLRNKKILKILSFYQALFVEEILQ